MIVDVFLCSSHKDEELQRELEQHLAVLSRSGDIRIWSDRSIEAGAEWETSSRVKLDAAHLILLLVSANFLASDRCMEIETTRALERHHAGQAQVIPVFLRPCDWSRASFAALPMLLGDSGAVTAWPDRHQAWERVARSIRAIVEELREASAEGGAPWSSMVSMNPFESSSTVPPERFTGRRAQIADVRGRIGGISAQSISLVGLRRSGKSSLFRYVAERIHEFCLPKQNPLVILLDLQAKQFHEPAGILEGLRRNIEAKTGRSPWRADQNEDGFAVNDGLELLRDQKVRLLVLLDEFERIGARLDRFQDWGEDWRSKASAGYFALGIATTRPLVEVYARCGLTSPFGNIFSTTTLGAFLQEEWKALVRAGFERSGAPPGDADLALIDELAGGLPYYVQMASALLWRHRIHEETRKAFREQAADRFRELWNGLPPAEHHALRYASGVPGLGAPEPDAIEFLTRHGLLRTDRRVFSSAFADFARALR